MRQIKFRCWFTDEHSVEEFRLTMQPHNKISLDGAWDAHTFGNGVLLQFTGLLDMNGKEVYEGDIVKTTFTGFGEPTQSVVYNAIAFQDGTFGYISELDRVKFCPLDDVGFSDGEVVGNIFENPDLVAKTLAQIEEEEAQLAEEAQQKALIWDEARFQHILDVRPVVKDELTNWLKWQTAFIEHQRADEFTEASIQATPWKTLREQRFDLGFTVKEAFKNYNYLNGEVLLRPLF
jgi:uncharacterized phage protein (TIGR01671 family)